MTGARHKKGGILMRCSKLVNAEFRDEEFVVQKMIRRQFAGAVQRGC